VEILRGIVRGKYLPGWNCLEHISVGGRIFHGKILHGGVFRRINSLNGIFCGNTFLLGSGGIYEKKFPQRGDFQQDLKNNQKLKFFQIKVG